MTMSLLRKIIRMRPLFLLATLVLPLLSAGEGNRPLPWGDQGNGTYINPVLNADYSDPDVIRVGEKYYMVCSEFHFMGMTIQESDDMVNWRIAGRVYDRLDFPAYDANGRYAGGSWAPSLRYHDGRFRIYFCTPHEGLFMTSASAPGGPWDPLLLVKAVEKWEDPCPFWDEDGQAYLGHSLYGAGPIIVHRMSPDGTRLLDEGVTVYTGPVAEGTKIHKWDGWYYMSIPEGGVERGWQTVLRSRSLYGPYEKKVVLERGSTPVNGPHQGALVDTPSGEWWFYHFQAAGAIGRVMHLQPVRWQEGWPLIGVDIDRNGIGEPVYVWSKPLTGGSFPVTLPATSDEFSEVSPGLQWQWNHNPDDAHWSMTAKKGWLLLHALMSDNLKNARNTLTQKVMGYTGEAVALLDGSGMAEGQKAGLCNFSSLFHSAGMQCRGGAYYLFFEGDGEPRVEITVKKPLVYLKLELNLLTLQNRFYYSTDNRNFLPLGSPFRPLWGHWKGTRIGLFSYNPGGAGGTAAFDFFRYTHDGPATQ